MSKLDLARDRQTGTRPTKRRALPQHGMAHPLGPFRGNAGVTFGPKVSRQTQRYDSIIQASGDCCPPQRSSRSTMRFVSLLAAAAVSSGRHNREICRSAMKQFLLLFHSARVCLSQLAGRLGPYSTIIRRGSSCRWLLPSCYTVSAQLSTGTIADVHSYCRSDI